MVVSKKCKICATLDPENVPISGEFLGKQIPDVILKISGVELDSRKINGILLCQQCSIMLVHVECFVHKLKKSLQRLQRTTKSAKTPKKDTGANGPVTTAKESSKKKPKIGNVAGFTKITDETKLSNGDENTGKRSPTKNSKRKLEFQENEASEELTCDNVAKQMRCSAENDENAVIDLETSIDKNKMFSNNDSCREESDYKLDDQAKTKNLNCVLCGKEFHQKRTLREHIESKHIGEKLKECPNCSMEFRSVQKYESHVFNEKCKSTLHACQVENCNRRFKNQNKMEEHMKEKHLVTNDTEWNLLGQTTGA